MDQQSYDRFVANKNRLSTYAKRAPNQLSRAYVATDDQNDDNQEADYEEDEDHEQAFVTIADLNEIEQDVRKVNTSTFYSCFQTTVTTSYSNDVLVFDPGATHHVISDPSYLHDLQKIPPISLHGVGGTSQITHRGTLTHFGTALYHPHGKYNLLSQRQLIQQGFSIYFNNDQNQYELYHQDIGTSHFKCNVDGLCTLPIKYILPLYYQTAKEFLHFNPKQLAKREK